MTLLQNQIHNIEAERDKVLKEICKSTCSLTYCMIHARQASDLWTVAVSSLLALISNMHDLSPSRFGLHMILPLSPSPSLQPSPSLPPPPLPLNLSPPSLPLPPPLSASRRTVFGVSSKDVKARYEKQLIELRIELKSLKMAKKEHTKAMKKNVSFVFSLLILPVSIVISTVTCSTGLHIVISPTHNTLTCITVICLIPKPCDV